MGPLKGLEPAQSRRGEWPASRLALEKSSGKHARSYSLPSAALFSYISLNETKKQNKTNPQ
jgi:hypothetical protein